MACGSSPPDGMRRRNSTARLADREANPEQRSRFEIIGHGFGIRWPELDEDISARR